MWPEGTLSLRTMCGTLPAYRQLACWRGGDLLPLPCGFPLSASRLGPSRARSTELSRRRTATLDQARLDHNQCCDSSGRTSVDFAKTRLGSAAGYGTDPGANWTYGANRAEPQNQ